MSNRLLVLDGSNVFIRNYCAVPQMDANGNHIGGTIGFLKTLSSLVYKLMPTKVIVVWEAGGSTRRRKLYPEYKQGRKPLKTNRFYDGDIPDTEENRVYQTVILTKLLKSLPICQVYVPNCEADDVIAWICKNADSEMEKVIVSSDKDFYQLLGEKVKIWNPAKKAFYTREDAVQEFSISPENFPLARAFAGDKSDNIPGAERIGLKTLAGKFDLSGDEVMLESILEKASKESEKKRSAKMWTTISNSEELVKRNLKLMKLNASMLSMDQVAGINKHLDHFSPKIRKMKFLQLYYKWGLSGLNHEKMLSAMIYLANKKS